jgi:hypothetical protein
MGGGDTGIAFVTTTTGKGLGAAGGALREHALSSIATITQDAVCARIEFAPGWVVGLCLRWVVVPNSCGGVGPL